jgi:hypothetical protein
MKDAINHFNAAFGFHLNPEAGYALQEMIRMVEVARLRGRNDIAEELQVAFEVVI